jgi:hypothetical protein
VQFRQEGPEFLDLAVLEQPGIQGPAPMRSMANGTDDHQPHAAMGTGPVEVHVSWLNS